ncbi:E3 ubiquitin-protein ligase RNF26 [Lissotriton helveticus]
MELVFLLIQGIGLAVDILTFVLDVNFWLVSTLLRVIFWSISFVLNVPNVLVTGLLQCWSTATCYALYVTEMFYCSIVGSIHIVANMVRSFVASLESLKVIGHLSSHLVLRSKEVVHKGVMNLILSGQSVLRHTCDVCTIIMSLVAYFINSLVNMCLIGTQNLFSITLALWDAVMGPFLRFTELLAAFLSHISSSAIAMAILFWTPCQLAFEFLISTIKIFINIFLLNLYGLILLLLIITVSVLVVNPALSRRIIDLVSRYFTALPSLQRVWRNVQRLHQMVLLSFQVIIRSDIWHRIAATALRMGNWNAAANAGHQAARGTVNPERQTGPPVNLGISAANQVVPAVQNRYQIPVAVNPGQQVGPRGRDNLQSSSVRDAAAPVCQNIQEPGERPGTSQENSPTNCPSVKENLDPAHNPWKLLKEQEERKMCVICQDHTKTVLLLPCRHLCLCCDCTKILLQQPIYQRNCPLCRQMILQTLNVYL